MFIGWEYWNTESVIYPQTVLNGIWTINESRGLYSGAAVYERPGPTLLNYDDEPGFARWKISKELDTDHQYCYCQSTSRNIVDCNGLWQCYLEGDSFTINRIAAIYPGTCAPTASPTTSATPNPLTSIKPIPSEDC